MRRKLELALFAILIALAVVLLYFRPLTSGRALGLDTMSHLSRTRYIQTFGIASWDFNWYSGMPFLKFYSPGFYYILSFFENILLWDNVICVLSLVLAALGIFFLVRYYTKSIYASFISAIIFLSSFCISYYYLAVGNHPFFSAIWTIPFALLFFEKSREKKYYFWLYSFIFASAFLLHVFIGLCLLGIMGLRILCNDNLICEKLKTAMIYILPPVLLSSFWLVPFFSKSSSFFGEGIFIPTPLQVLGFDTKMLFGLAGASIGMSFFLFVSCLFLFKKLKEKREWLFFFLSSIVFFLLFMGILGKYYPTGIGSIRFAVPFSIIMSCFIGVSIGKINLNKTWRAFIFLFILGLLLFNLTIINANYERYSHNSEDERFGRIYESFLDKSFPLKEAMEINNYRFGTNRPDIAKSFNLVFPGMAQTSGYYDQGILFPESFFEMFDNIWNTENISLVKRTLDMFGVRYFDYDSEIRDSDFRLVYKNNILRIYEYMRAKPVVSVISYEGAILDLSDLGASVLRNQPDEIVIHYNFTGREAILFKEFYHTSWNAMNMDDKEKIGIKKTEDNLMLVVPGSGANAVLLYQRNLPAENIGIILSIAGFFVVFFCSKKALKRDFS